ncbi:hypothetical protein RRG08_034233 [Elysia crispata]|uniref:Uncharacterized protein n=1 Tax=Elysia crispata TaxID=231223 RepID=A0AAE1A117_9GAST|nr:hypothetical protein RRG08_034233 [Elysia crispata]
MAVTRRLYTAARSPKCQTRFCLVDHGSVRRHCALAPKLAGWEHFSIAEGPFSTTLRRQQVEADEADFMFANSFSTGLLEISPTTRRKSFT